MSKILLCDYAGCDISLPEEEMTVLWEDEFEGKWVACPDCVDKVEDYTGYCGVSCQFGGGCSQEC